MSETAFITPEHIQTAYPQADLDAAHIYVAEDKPAEQS